MLYATNITKHYTNNQLTNQETYRK